MSSSFFSSRGTSRSIASVLKVVGIAILVIGLVLVFTGCGGKAGIVGKWHSDGEADTVEFTSDGKMTVTPDSGEGALDLTYKVEGSKITISAMGIDQISEFTIDGDTMTVSPEGDAQMVYKRVK